MSHFLDKLAGELLNKHGSDISELQIVFPSRRAGLYFKKYLSEKINTPVWAPVTYGISEYIRENSDQLIADDLTLIFELYEVYKEFAEEVTFDKFYPWGEIILRDFDEIDKNLADANYLFRILREHKKVEEDFEYNVADLDEFYRFWNSFSERDITGLQDEFIKTWEILGKVYHKFRERLLGLNICYEGMAYRQLYEKVQMKQYVTGYKKIIFAGFNQLNRCEEGIIKGLLANGSAEIYWDADKYYIDDKLQESGKFLRENFVNLEISEPNWIGNSLAESAINIKMIGSPLEVSQAKVLGSELEKLKQDTSAKTAIILPDDSLLMPVLRSIPGSISAINITMGYSFKNSLLFSLFELLRDLNLNSRGEGSSKEFYHRDIIGVLLHPYIRETAPEMIRSAINSINRRNVIYASAGFPGTFFSDTIDIINSIFVPADSAGESFEYLNRIIVNLYKTVSNSPHGNIYEMEFLNRASTEMNRLKDILNKYTAEIESETFWNILIQNSGRMKIPFSGEPLEGIQIMGMLETRSIDFDNVFILSVNEGILPAETNSSSFIPFALRRAFRLPVSEDTEADYAYYFYRLLQKAKNVTLLYNTETGVISAGEKSRFLMQIENELAVKNTNIKTENLLLQGDIELPERKEITIEKSPKVLSLLKDQKQYSATTLSAYINCPLQFYFKKAAGLNEEEEVEEYFSAAAFGNIFHQLMDILYRDHIGMEVTEEVIDSKLAYLNGSYDELWQKACDELKEYREFAKIKQGKNLLYKSVIKKLAGSVLNNDRTETPFGITELENAAERTVKLNIDGEVTEITLYGRLDRVEIKDGITRIIDYKTGTVDNAKQSSKVTDEDHIARVFSDIKLKENFQQLFYASLYLNANKRSNLIVGIYPLKRITGGVFWFEEEPISAEKIKLFEDNLKMLLKKIFDKTTPFTQTTDVEHCKYCPYKSICYRD
ncbi:MAG TPA: PD-(D/E)XK nuclease family protein [Ignavibacteria bacterium]|nr:PD-(D/E)XK nuclease family protein [Ignavibacteria bacterium]HMQ98580.1 PD-(D/E)XK nuclease family protein [Ignavibacteria bacterium]